jgi:hypothetical protein
VSAFTYHCLYSSRDGSHFDAILHDHERLLLFIYVERSSRQWSDSSDMIYTERPKLGTNFRKGFSIFLPLLIFAIPAFLIKLHVQDILTKTAD